MSIEDIVKMYEKLPQGGAFLDILENKSIDSVFLNGLMASATPIFFASLAVVVLLYLFLMMLMRLAISIMICVWLCRLRRKKKRNLFSFSLQVIGVLLNMDSAIMPARF